MLALAVLCAAHARMAERREWVLNEKGLARRAGLSDAGALLPDVAAVASALGVQPLARP
jgi:hypothetical protein